MAEPEVPSLSECPQQWGLEGVTPTATIYSHVGQPTIPISHVSLLLQELW